MYPFPRSFLHSSWSIACHQGVYSAPRGDYKQAVGVGSSTDEFTKADRIISLGQWLVYLITQVTMMSFFFKWFIFVLSRHCCGQAFPGCGKWGGYSLVAVCGLLIAEASLVVAHGLQGARALVVVARGLHSCGSQALEHRLDSYGTQTLLLRGTWDFLRPGMEPMSPALAGGFFTTEPPGRPYYDVLSIDSFC